MKYFFILFFVFIGFEQANASIQKFKLNESSGMIEFTALGNPSALTIKGKGVAPRGNLEVSQNVLSGEAEFDLATLDTERDLRNKHMKEKYLQVDRFPIAKLKVLPLKLPRELVGKTELQDLELNGTLTLHGIEKPIKGKLSFSGDNGINKINAQFSIKLSDFGIETPSFAGITIAEDVKVQVESGVLSQPL